MSTNKYKEFIVGRGGKAKLHDLKDEPKSKHYDTASRKQMKNAGHTNTVGDEQMIKKDISRIKNGEAKRTTTRKNQTSRFTLDNGRTYRAGAKDANGKVTMFPEKGPGLTQLNKNQSRALGTLNDHGIKGHKAHEAMKKDGISANEANKALTVWQKGKGKDASSKDMKAWKRQYEKEYKKKNSATMTHNQSSSTRKR